MQSNNCYDAPKKDGISNQKSDSDRMLCVDLIKILSTFLIVLQHSMSQEWVRLASEQGRDFWVFNFIYMLSKAGVPLFIMCSGWGMLRKERTVKSIFVKNIGILLVTYVNWMLIYGVVEALKASSVRTAINSILKSVLFGQYHTWFIATLIGLYLIVPFLQEFIRKDELINLFILLSFFFTVLVPIIDGFDGVERVSRVIQDVNMKFVAGYTLFFVLGFKFSLIRNKNSMKIFFTLMLGITWMLGATISYKKSFFVGQSCQDIYTEFSIIGVLFCVALFGTLFIMVDNKKTTDNKFLNTIVHLGIGIYFIHPLFLPLINGFHLYVRFLGAVVVYLCSALVCYVISITPLKKYFLIQGRK